MKGLKDQQPAVIDHQRQAPALLSLRPANPLLPQLQLVSSGAPDQQRHPLSLVLRHVTQLFAHKIGVVQIMTFSQKKIEPLAFLGTDQADLHPTDQGLLRFTQNWPMFRFHRHFSKKNASRCPAQNASSLKLKDLLAWRLRHMQVFRGPYRCHFVREAGDSGSRRPEGSQPLAHNGKSAKVHSNFFSLI